MCRDAAAHGRARAGAHAGAVPCSEDAVNDASTVARQQCERHRCELR